MTEEEAAVAAALLVLRRRKDSDTESPDALEMRARVREKLVQTRAHLEQSNPTLVAFVDALTPEERGLMLSEVEADLRRYH